MVCISIESLGEHRSDAEWIVMNPSMQRRAFLVAGAISIPSIALASGATGRWESNDGMEFHDLMKQAGTHLKSMRSHMEDLTAPGARDEAAFLANQVTILMAQCIVVAEQVEVPERSADKYEGEKDKFISKLRMGLADSVDASNALLSALLAGKDERAVTYYGKLRKERKDGHDAFKEDD